MTHKRVPLSCTQTPLVQHIGSTQGPHFFSTRDPSVTHQKPFSSTGGTVAPQWAWVPRSLPLQQILSLQVKCAGPQFRRPPKNCASPEFSYSLILRENRSGSPVSAFICWVCKKHAVSPQMLRLPRIFPFLNITRLPRNSVTPQFWCANQKVLRRQTNHSARFWRKKTSLQIYKIFTNFKPSKYRLSRT